MLFRKSYLELLRISSPVLFGALLLLVLIGMVLLGLVRVIELVVLGFEGRVCRLFSEGGSNVIQGLGRYYLSVAVLGRM